ncbi:MAG TPA: thioredoxin domain-containing protein [Gemmatimonadales bacterium]|nr:thioredoxin domain-containing protein [Gemmatimonadales bacterium]
MSIKSGQDQTDYQCPACKRFEREIDVAREHLGDSLGVVYHNFPLRELHPLALAAAEGAVCAAAQGRFEQIHRALFNAVLQGDSIQWGRIIAASDIPDTTRFRACLQLKDTQEQVEQERQSGIDLRLGGTPGVLIADRLQVGGMSAEELLARLHKARRKLVALHSDN